MEVRPSYTTPRIPTLACAYADRPAGGGGCRSGTAALRAIGAAGCLVAVTACFFTRIAGRGGGSGTFCSAAMAVCALIAPMAVSANARPQWVPLIVFIHLPSLVTGGRLKTPRHRPFGYYACGRLPKIPTALTQPPKPGKNAAKW